MNALERLTRDHAILRSKLAVLEGALAMGQEAWYVLREMAFTLSKQVADHMRREERLIEACKQQLDPEALAHIRLEHRDEPAHLRTITRLFSEDERQSLELIRPALLAAIHGLRDHMGEEERMLFPVIAQALGARELAPETTAAARGRLDETMTVNRLVHEHPMARTVLERHFISIPLDGCYSLDEVAWRHGMEADELVKQLEDVVAQKGA